MSANIEFYFDFSSPYSYIVTEPLEALAAGFDRSVVFKPTLLGAIFKISGQKPLIEVPLKGDYSRRDIARSARYAGVPCNLPQPFPISTVQAARACLVLQTEHPDLAHGFIHAAFRAYFVQGRNIATTDVLAQVLGECGANATEVLEAANRNDIKEQLKLEVDAAIARGVCGAPFFFIDGEPFWGSDRLPQMQRWMATGPF